jgi:hypothetical protein
MDIKMAINAAGAFSFVISTKRSPNFAQGQSSEDSDAAFEDHMSIQVLIAYVWCLQSLSSPFQVQHFMLKVGIKRLIFEAYSEVILA